MRVGVIILVAILGALSAPGTLAVAAGTTLIVNSSADTTDGACTTEPGGCTLREAIEAANANGNPDVQDTIAFAIPGDGVQTIHVGTGNPPTADLPPILQPAIIDGSTQPGASCEPRNLLIAIDGTGVSGGGFGLNLAGAPSVVRGLSIYGASVGVVLQGDGRHIVECSHLGVDATGTSVRGEGKAMHIASDDNLVGGDTTTAANVIGGFEGITVESSRDNRVANNAFGVALDHETLLEGQGRSGIGLHYEGPIDLFFEYNTVAGWDIGVMGEGGYVDPPELEVVLAHSTFGVAGTEPGHGPGNRVGVVLIDTAGVWVRSSGVHANAVGIQSVNSSLVQVLDSEIRQNSDCGLSAVGVGTMYALRTAFTDNERGMCAVGTTPRIGATQATFRGGNIGMDYEGTGAGRSISANSSVFMGVGAAIEATNPGGVWLERNQFGFDAFGQFAPNGIDVSVNAYSVSPLERIEMLDNQFKGTLGIPVQISGPVDLRLLQNRIEGGPGESNESGANPGLLLIGLRDLWMLNNIVIDADGPGMVLDYTGQESGAELYSNEFIRSRGAGVEVTTGDFPVLLSHTTVTDNLGPGILLRFGTAHIENGIFSGNAGIPIDLGGDGPSPNDTGDTDDGPNMLLNAPLVEVRHVSDRGVHIEARGTLPPGTIAAKLAMRVGANCDGYIYGLQRSYVERMISPESSSFVINEFLAGARLGDGVAVALSHADTSGTWRTSEFSPCDPVQHTSALTITGIEPPAIKVRNTPLVATIRNRQATSNVRAYANGQELTLLEASVGNPGTLKVLIPVSMLGQPDELKIYLEEPDGNRSNTYKVYVSMRSLSDRDYNDRVDGDDVLCALRWLIRKYNGCGSMQDVNLDGELDIADVVYIRRVVAGLAPE